MPYEKKGKKVKATLILDPEDRRFIELTGRSLQDFFTSLFNTYKRLDMNKWRNGVVVHRGRRIIMFDAEGLNQIIEQLKNPYETGKAIARQINETGKALNIFASDPKAAKKWIEDSGRLHGWGTIECSPNRLIIERPTITNEEFTRGYFEELLQASLSCRLANRDIQIFIVDEARKIGG